MSAPISRSIGFRPGRATTAATIAVVALTLAAAQWQTHRAEFKESLARRFDQLAAAPLLDVSGGRMDAAELEFARIRITGEFLPGKTIYLDNRVYRSQAGYHVVSPLKTAEGAPVVLINRGWVPAGPSRELLPPIETPAGRQTVEGIAVVPPRRVFELAADSKAGPIRQNLLPDRLSQELGVTLAPLVIQQTSPAVPGLVQDWPRPDFGAEKHRMYALQWYSFAGLALVLYVALNLRFKR